MEDLVVTRYWMAGVIAVMLVFAAVALIGVLRNRRK